MKEWSAISVFQSGNVISAVTALGIAEKQSSGVARSNIWQCKVSSLKMEAHDLIRDKFWHSCLNKIGFSLTDFRTEKDARFGSQDMNL